MEKTGGFTCHCKTGFIGSGRLSDLENHAFLRFQAQLAATEMSAIEKSTTVIGRPRASIQVAVSNAAVTKE